MRFRFLLAAGSWLIFSKCALAALVNVTIDDTFGDPKTGAQVTYFPDGWNNGTNCSECTARPDVGRVYLATVSRIFTTSSQAFDEIDIHPTDLVA
jgi:hypothetical protein